jgi:predicted glycoside hydrolase/deacetylase ChbG (UPF0249 family)
MIEPDGRLRDPLDRIIALGLTAGWIPRRSGRMERMKTSNALLGYPDDARLLLVNADDFGSTHGNTVAIFEAIARGIVGSTSLMVPCPWSAWAMAWLCEHREVPFAIHLTMVCEYPAYRWGPVSPRTEVMSLLAADGNFPTLEFRDDLLEDARIEDVETEFRAQIEFVRSAGLQPTHLDWHCLADGGRDDISDLTAGLAEEYGLAMRTHGRGIADRLRGEGHAVVDQPIVDSYGIPVDGRMEAYLTLLRAMPAGVTEWAVHPGLGNDEHRTLEPDTWGIRRGDLDVVTSTAIRDAIAAEGITLITWREMRATWAQAT